MCSLQRSLKFSQFNHQSLRLLLIRRQLLKQKGIKILTLIFLIFINSRAVSAVEPIPEAQAVPETTARPSDVPDTKTSKSTKGALKNTKIGLIKTEKDYVDKNCHVIGGKVKCKHKKVQKKTIDEDEDIKELKENPLY